MSIKVWFRTHFVRRSFEYIVRQIENIPLRGEDKILARAEKYRLQLELYNYFKQRLDIIISQIGLKNLPKMGLYVTETSNIGTYCNRIIGHAIALQNEVGYGKILDTLPRNNSAVDVDNLFQSYRTSSYKNVFTRIVALIDNYINECKDKNK